MMGLSRKRKQHLEHITIRAAKSNKHQKVVRENREKKLFRLKQQEEEDFWDEYEEASSASSSDDSTEDESSHDKPSSDEENSEEEGDRRRDNTREGLGDDDDGGVQLDKEKHTFQPTWSTDAGGYLRGVRGCGSSATEKRERRKKRELEKSASHTRSITDMFAVQTKKNELANVDDLSLTPAAFFPLANLSKGGKNKKKSASELGTQAAHEISELLRLKTAQIEKYGTEFSHRSNFFRRHQMVQSFLWMQMNKKKDNPDINRRGLAQIVAQSFNKRAYTGRKIVQWERLWVRDRIIPRTKVGEKSDNLSWMEDEDLVLSIKEWAKNSGESKEYHD